ncbi:MAG: DUF6051 family protein [Deltaproteobacteria bacterium]|jgi:hypothetical protein|nr:DUF6051 family protein [Deltaproteobacteria bacterium]
MSHLSLHNHLKEIFSLEPREIDLTSDLILRNYDFHSSGTKWIGQKPGAPPDDLLKRLGPEAQASQLADLFDKLDPQIDENLNFRYFVIGPKDPPKSSQAIILLHGLNERFWDKYLPMAVYLARNTKKSVLLFPTSFHMNRSPALWTEAKLMRSLSQWRKSLYPDLEEGSLSNAAISFRLQKDPARFFWSGLQMFEDLVALVKAIIAGQHPAFAPNSSIDFFTYSIGTFISEIVFMTNPENLFSKSRLVLFCGGPVFSRMKATSKFIIDSLANHSLSTFLLTDLKANRQNDPHLDFHLGQTPLGQSFLAMLDLDSGQDYREERLKALSSRILALALEKDSVVPAAEVLRTLQGARSQIDIPVSLIKPSYPYRHEDPFPTLAKYESQVDEWFDRIMSQASEFLR